MSAKIKILYCEDLGINGNTIAPRLQPAVFLRVVPGQALLLRAGPGYLTGKHPEMGCLS